MKEKGKVTDINIISPTSFLLNHNFLKLWPLIIVYDPLEPKQRKDGHWEAEKSKEKKGWKEKTKHKKGSKGKGSDKKYNVKRKKKLK